MKLYVINLDRSPDRLLRLEGIFARQGLTLTRVTAIDERNISDVDYQKLTARQLWPDPMTRGEVACFLSHRLALQCVVQGQETYSAIFEDDVCLSSHAHIFLRHGYWIPSGINLIKLETHGKKVWLGPPVTLMSGFSLSKLKSTHIMAAAYIISRQAAAYLTRRMEYVYAPFDHFLFNVDLDVIATTLQMHQLDPAIAIQAKLKSTLEHERVCQERTKKKKRSLMETLRREILRIEMRSRIGLWGLKTNLTSDERWKRISFGKGRKFGRIAF